jgi:hypothetical protein
MPAPTTLLDLSILPTYSCLNTYMYIIWTLNYVAGLPVKRHHEVKSKVKSWCLAKKRDLESGRGRNSGDLGSVSDRNQRGGLLNYLKIPKGILELPLYIEIRSSSPMHWNTFHSCQH